MTITENVVAAANANYITIDELVWLYTMYFQLTWPLTIMPASLNKLKRLGLINDDELTSSGETVLFYCLDLDQPTKVEVINEDSFEEIWKLFPRDDSYRHFGATRTIRWNKKETKVQYQKALEEYTHQQLLNALKSELAYRAANSTKENLFKYLKSSVNWFKDQAYLNFIDDDEKLNLDNEFGKEVS